MSHIVNEVADPALSVLADEEMHEYIFRKKAAVKKLFGFILGSDWLEIRFFLHEIDKWVRKKDD